MEFFKFLVKSLVILAMILLMAAPFVLEFYTFKRDKEKKISYKRFRILVYSFVYIIAITLAMYFVKDLILWLQTLSFVQWITLKLAISTRTVYCCQVLVAILVNFGIGLLYILFSKFVRIGLKKKNLLKPNKKNNEFDWAQKVERKIIKFFYHEAWFLVGRILKYLSIVLSIAYGIMFAIYQIPAIFVADWLRYDLIAALFTSGYIYPTITLLGLWEAYFFLEGIKNIKNECPELLENDLLKREPIEVDLNAIDEEVRKQFEDYYACDADLSTAIQDELQSAHHCELTKFIAQAVENDKRNPHLCKETYLDCLDRLVADEKSLLINGSLYSEFSMYFLRYLSVITARGDNIVFVCNSDAQIDTVYDYLTEGLSEISSLYCKNFQKDAVDFDDTIWRVLKVSGERNVVEEASVDECNILVTSLAYLCSTRFEAEHSNFITLINNVVFIDTLNTVNTFNRQLAVLNTRLRHIAKANVDSSKNSNVKEASKAMYSSRPIRYLCFDDTRTPGLDKVLKNMLNVDFDSIDSMRYTHSTIVRCYNYEGKPDEDGRTVFPQFIHTDEIIGAVINMAVLCLNKGASNVSVYTNDIVPFSNIAESIAANSGQVSISIDGSNLRLNKQFYNPDEYSVIIAVDSGTNLPATIRKYVSITSDKPALVIVFSRPYMLRDYYTSNLSELWINNQIERIPVEEGTKKDVAQRIIVKANAGGISKSDLFRAASSIPQYDNYVKCQDVDSILCAVLEVYGLSPKDKIELFQYFEYCTTHDFDETGKYRSEVKIILRRQGKLFDLINGRDMIVMSVGDSDIVLPMPKSRLTQNYIAGQNLLYNGNVYYILKIDSAEGVIYARLAVSGENDEAYKYIQAREYRLEMDDEQIELAFQPKHVTLKREEDDISVSEVSVYAFKAPMEVFTRGYYDISPYTLAMNSDENLYHSLTDEGNYELAKQTYRRYGILSAPQYSSDSIIRVTHLISNEKPALMMAIKICGNFGADINKTMTLASVMLNEMLKSMFPSVADSIVVCPILHEEFSDDESETVLCRQPRISITGEHDFISKTDFELVIIEDCPTDLGVISVLMSDGDDMLNTLFAPLYKYLKWYSESDVKNEYLYYGLGHEPACFDFQSLFKLSKILGDDKHDLKFIDMESILEYDSCDFCGKRFAKGNDVSQLEDGRKMCKSCAESLVGNNKKLLKAYWNSAKVFLESTYGITIDDDYEFVFDSTEHIVNTLKQNHDLVKRGSDVPLKSYIDDNKKVHIEYSIPPVNLSELLVRELTHVWQLKYIPKVAEDLAEGHIALVATQYLRFLNQNFLACVRTSYYESTDNISGEGYRKLVHELLANPQFNNNPFRYLLEFSGTVAEDAIVPVQPRIIQTGNYGLPYVPENPDRALDGNISYFFFSRLDATCQKAYNAMLSAIKNHEATVTVTDCSFADVSKISNAISYDHPELFWYNSLSMCGDVVTFIYGASAEEVAALQKRIDDVIPKYLEGITDSMSAYDVALRIHIKVISSVDYDTVALNKQREEGGPKNDKIDYLRTICGVFLNGKAVCEGYTRAIAYLLQKCGIECAEAAGNIRGSAEESPCGHAWNILKIDGDYYYLDTTWDDSSNTVQTVKTTDLGFDYFNITTEELVRTREVDMCPVEMPLCTATRGNYYYHNDLVLDSYDLSKIKKIAQTAAESKNKAFTFKCKSKALFEQAQNKMCVAGQDCYDVLKVAAKADKQILSNSYSYSLDSNIWTITVKFKYK